jgi:hypothetical protein
MEMDFAQMLVNNGVAGIVLAWFMFKNNKDMERFSTMMEEENKQTREVLSDLKTVIAKIGGVGNE